MLILKATPECNQQEERQQMSKSSRRPSSSRHHHHNSRFNSISIINREKAAWSRMVLTTITLCQVKMASNRHKWRTCGHWCTIMHLNDQSLRIKVPWCIAMIMCQRVRGNKRWLAATIAWALARACIGRIRVTSCQVWRARASTTCPEMSARTTCHRRKGRSTNLGVRSRRREARRDWRDTKLTSLRCRTRSLGTSGVKEIKVAFH